MSIVAKIILWAGFPKGRKNKVTSRDLADKDFRSSTARMGLSFDEKLRDGFRSKWLKKK